MEYGHPGARHLLYDSQQAEHDLLSLSLHRVLYLGLIILNQFDNQQLCQHFDVSFVNLGMLLWMKYEPLTIHYRLEQVLINLCLPRIRNPFVILLNNFDN